MISNVHGPIAAEPQLHLALQHIARTPTARLGIVYEIAPRRPGGYQPAALALEVNTRSVPARIEDLAALATGALRGSLQPRLGEGERLYLDSILAGGVDGEWLPLSISVRREAYQQVAANGTALNLVA